MTEIERFFVDPEHPGSLSEAERHRYRQNLDRLRTLGWKGVRHLPQTPPTPSSSHLLVRTLGGFATLFYGYPTGQQSILHHLEDPDRKAAKWWESRTCEDLQTGVLFLGLGLGYSIPHLLKMAEAGVPLLLVEPDPLTFAFLLCFQDIEPLVHHPRIHLLLTPDPQEATREALAWLREHPLPKYRWIVDPPGMLPAPLFLRDWFNDLAQQAPAVAPTLARELRRNYPYPTNLSENWGIVQQRPGIGRLFGALKGQPAVVVGAGPSLDEQLPGLRGVQEGAAIIACDTAVRPLLAAGVRVDIALAMDSSPANRKHFVDLPNRDFLPCLYAGVDPDLLRDYQETAWLAASAFFPTAELLDAVPGPNTYLMNKGWLVINGSVGSSAIDLALKLGAGSIYLAGLDLGYPAGRDHAVGTLYDTDKAFQDRQPGRFEVPCVDGGRVPTATAFLASLLGVTHQVARTEIPIHNLSAKGARIPGTLGHEEGWERLLELAANSDAEPPAARLARERDLAERGRRRPLWRGEDLNLDNGWAIDNRGRIPRLPEAEDRRQIAERNLAVLRDTCPRVARVLEEDLGVLDSGILSDGRTVQWFRGREGYPRLLIRDSAGRIDAVLPAVESPWEEIAEWDFERTLLEPPGVAFLGLGLGYHVRAVMKARPGCPLWVWEPLVDRLRLALGTVDLRDLFANRDIRWSVGETPAEALVRMLRETPQFLESLPLSWRPWVIPGFRNWAHEAETEGVESWLRILSAIHPIPEKLEVREVAAEELEDPELLKTVRAEFKA
jgi:hypothetical protein